RPRESTRHFPNPALRFLQMSSSYSDIPTFLFELIQFWSTRPALDAKLLHRRARARHMRIPDQSVPVAFGPAPNRADRRYPKSARHEYPLVALQATFLFVFLT